MPCTAALLLAVMVHTASFSLRGAGLPVVAAAELPAAVAAAAELPAAELPAAAAAAAELPAAAAAGLPAAAPVLLIHL